MYNAVIPTYKNNEEKGKKQQETIKADDPKNKQRIHDIIDSLD
jgi:hypothetical protein